MRAACDRNSPDRIPCGSTILGDIQDDFRGDPVDTAHIRTAKVLNTDRFPIGDIPAWWDREIIVGSGAQISTLKAANDGASFFGH